ncbi:peptidoglycan DD-metalloendopeptidase family protein [Gramella sp. KN1008]|uniref:peptidoglycan DD-metalloendopeptidase family protein n=1 Tax=Gramella sp. KN1008 TaxID=2529298 RepID=UPI00103D7A6E|nr:peptidoglycan DD-metalloendopeptidase family protein [Gramella sp. KN1008]TBW26488.1 peptidase M23 [Gramella sp. KN1008]
MQDFSEFVKGITSGYTPVIGEGYKKEDFAYIDLSANNPELLKLEVASSEAFSVFISEFLKNKQAKAAYGGYNELRTLYNRSELFNNAEANRNIHIGLDIWAPAFVDILSPLEGKIHSFRDNDKFGDYGPTLILEHSIDGREFFTLYGHLTRGSLKGPREGEPVNAGEKIGELGDFEENGDYAPHLHFQVIEDLKGNTGDFPGVIKKEDLDDYLKNCPDPNLLLKI